MSENVKVPYGKGSDHAVLLLAAAEELGLDPGVVRTTLHGYEVPKEVADKASVDTYDPDEEFNKEIEEARKDVSEPAEAPGSDMTLSRSGYDEQEANSNFAEDSEKPVAKKAPAKKTAAKKTAAKKTTAKKAAAKKSTGQES